MLRQVGRLRECAAGRHGVGNLSGGRLSSEHVPITVCALERLAAVVRPLVDRERARDGERLATPGEVARVRLCPDGTAIAYVSYVVRKNETRALDALSCVCRRMCCASVAASEKFWLHTLHWNGRWPVWL